MENEVYYIIKDKKVLLKDVIDMQKNIYNKGNKNIITLEGLHKIADKEGIVEKQLHTEITPSESNKQQHAVNIWLGFKNDKQGMPDERDSWVRGDGEASVFNTGNLVTTPTGRKYEEYNYVDSNFRFAMACKRAYSRAMLKLIKLYGFYSEVESTNFSRESTDTNKAEPYNY